MIEPFALEQLAESTRGDQLNVERFAESESGAIARFTLHHGVDRHAGLGRDTDDLKNPGRRRDVAREVRHRRYGVTGRDPVRSYLRWYSAH